MLVVRVVVKTIEAFEPSERICSFDFKKCLLTQLNDILKVIELSKYLCNKIFCTI